MSDQIDSRLANRILLGLLLGAVAGALTLVAGCSGSGEQSAEGGFNASLIGTSYYVQQSYVIDEGSPDPGGLPHRYVIKSMLPIGFALFLLQGVAWALKSFHKLKTAR